MSGIHRSRIVGKEEDELDDLTCSICQNILEEPVVTQCCRQTFCSLCIKQWVLKNNTCPNDQGSLNVKQLLPAPKIIINLLKKLQVKCVFYGERCKSVLSIEEMASHIKVCNTCDSCKTSKKLLTEKQRENELLKSKLDKFELDQLNGKLRDLKISKPTTQRSELEAIKTSMRTSSPYIEFSSNLTEDEVNYLIDLAKKALAIENTFFDMARFIHDNINSNENLRDYLWVIVVDIKWNVRNIHYSAHKDFRIIFNNLLIGFTGCKINLPESEEIEVSSLLFDQYKLTGRKNVDDHLVNLYVNECKYALKCQDSFEGLANQLREKLEGETKTIWAVVAYTSDSVSYCLRTYKNILVTFNRLKINAYEIRI